MRNELVVVEILYRYAIQHITVTQYMRIFFATLKLLSLAHIYLNLISKSTEIKEQYLIITCFVVSMLSTPGTCMNNSNRHE